MKVFKESSPYIPSSESVSTHHALSGEFEHWLRTNIVILLAGCVIGIVIDLHLQK
jgi:hypothetical protein